jgi:hypothetical protein
MHRLVRTWLYQRMSLVSTETFYQLAASSAYLACPGWPPQGRRITRASVGLATAAPVSLRLAAIRLASEPACSLVRMIRVRRDSCGWNRKNSALCELFTSDLRCDVCNMRARAVKNVATAFESLRRLDRGDVCE